MQLVLPTHYGTDLINIFRYRLSPLHLFVITFIIVDATLETDTDNALIKFIFDTKSI